MEVVRRKSQEFKGLDNRSDYSSEYPAGAMPMPGAGLSRLQLR